jgi:hypothetical protein
MTEILIVCAVLIVVLACTTASRADFRERFPPITDAEFLARCKPGTDPRVALKVRRIVADHFAIEYERVHPSMTFVEDIGAD